LLVRFEVMERSDHERLTALTRAGRDLEPVVERWYAWATTRPAVTGTRVEPVPLPDDLAGFDQALSLALRPFLTRCAQAILPRLDLSRWRRGFCPLCGNDPELAVITTSSERWMICGRCRGRWPFDPVACPACGNDDRLRLTTFATPDGHYRINACDVCLRYVKAYDERSAGRPVLVAADTIATLPLDAAAMQRGYTG
jgi:FdhE protein